MAKKAVTLPINTPPLQNVDGMVLDQLSETLYDGFIDELGNTNKRAGLTPHTDLGSFKRSEGAYWFENQEMALFHSDGSIYKVTDDSGTVVNITNTGDKISSDGRAVFADNGTTFVACNGSKIVYSNGTANTAFVTDADAPTNVSHVAFLDHYLICNNVGTGKFHWCDFTSDSFSFSSLDFTTAESNPDNVIALFVVRRTIVLMGSSTIEFYQNNGLSPFARLNGMEIGRGIMAKHAAVNVNGILYFFDDKRRLCLLDGYRLTQLSTAFDKPIQAMSTVSDCVADYEHYDGINQIRFTFPTEKRSFVYNLDLNYWSEDSYYNSSSNERENYLGFTYVYAKGWNQHLVGSRYTGEVFKLDKTTYTDNVQPIRFSKTTGHIDHDLPHKKKRSYSITFRFKTGVGIGTNNNTEPMATIRWRDNGSQVWGNYRQIPLKIQGDTEFIYKISNLGSYYTRQYEITFSQDAPFIIGKAVEEVEI